MFQRCVGRQRVPHCQMPQRMQRGTRALLGLVGQRVQLALEPAQQGRVQLGVRRRHRSGRDGAQLARQIGVDRVEVVEVLRQHLVFLDGDVEHLLDEGDQLQEARGVDDVVFHERRVVGKRRAPGAHHEILFDETADGRLGIHHAAVLSASAWPRARPVFLILPVSVLGNASTNSMYFGAMKVSSLVRQWRITSRSVNRTPGSRVMKALMAWPRISSSTPITATSCTPGSDWIAFSTSRGLTFSPRVLMMSSRRATKYSQPSASVRKRSPE